MIIKLTKKCNLNCFYCKDHDESAEEVLSLDDVCEMVKQAVEKGEHTFDLAGGEPLLYPDIEILVAKLKEIEGVDKVTITTNGLLLLDKLEALRTEGIDGINIHMDVWNAFNYAEITGAESVLNEVLGGIWTSVAKDIPVAISVVLHEKSISSVGVMAGFAKKMDISIRFVPCSDAIQFTEDEVINILKRHFKDLKEIETHVYNSSELKGRIVFADKLEEAFV